MAKNLLDLLEEYKKMERISKTIQSDDDDCSTYYLPEKQSGKVEASLIAAERQGYPIYWYITLAVRYDITNQTIEVRAIEDVTNEDEGFHLQRFSFFKRNSSSNEMCNHKNNMNLGVGNVPSQSEIPCGKTLDLYAGTSNGGCLSKPGENSSSYPVLNMTKLKEDTDIPVKQIKEEKCIKSRDSISQEYGFSIDIELASEMFNCIFSQNEPYLCAVAFIRGIDMGESSTQVLSEVLSVGADHTQLSNLSQNEEVETIREEEKNAEAIEKAYLYES